jgi:hypothetical protein
MKKRLLFIVLFLSSVTGFSQCDFDENKYDDFKKWWVTEKKIQVRLNMLGEGETFYFRKVDNNYYLNIQVARTSSLGVIREGAELMLMLTNDTIISLKSTELTTSIIHPQGSYIVAKYSMSENDLKWLRYYPLKKFRIYFTDSYMDFDVKEEKQKKIENAAGCMIDVKNSK